jgi:hypothetical protein
MDLLLEGYLPNVLLRNRIFAGNIAQVAECLPSMLEASGSISTGEGVKKRTPTFPTCRKASHGTGMVISTHFASASMESRSSTGAR